MVPWEPVQASNAGVETSPIHWVAERETEAAECNGEHLESAMGRDAPSWGRGFTSLRCQFLSLKIGLAIPPSQNGCEGSLALCMCVLTKGKLTIGVSATDIALVQHVTMGKSLFFLNPH